MHSFILILFILLQTLFISAIEVPPNRKSIIPNRKRAGESLRTLDFFGPTNYGFACGDKNYQKCELYAAAKKICDMWVKNRRDFNCIEEDNLCQSFKSRFRDTVFTNQFKYQFEGYFGPYLLYPILRDMELYEENTGMDSGTDRIVIDKQCNLITVVTSKGQTSSNNPNGYISVVNQNKLKGSSSGESSSSLRFANESGPDQKNRKRGLNEVKSSDESSFEWRNKGDLNRLPPEVSPRRKTRVRNSHDRTLARASRHLIPPGTSSPRFNHPPPNPGYIPGYSTPPRFNQPRYNSPGYSSPGYSSPGYSSPGSSLYNSPDRLDRSNRIWHNTGRLTPGRFDDGYKSPTHIVFPGSSPAHSIPFQNNANSLITQCKLMESALWMEITSHGSVNLKS